MKKIRRGAKIEWEWAVPYSNLFPFRFLFFFGRYCIFGGRWELTNGLLTASDSRGAWREWKNGRIRRGVGEERGERERERGRYQLS
jgi:hypothetical protein